jgi:hypothetical protein
MSDLWVIEIPPNPAPTTTASSSWEGLIDPMFLGSSLVFQEKLYVLEVSETQLKELSQESEDDKFRVSDMNCSTVNRIAAKNVHTNRTASSFQVAQAQSRVPP